MKPTIFPKSLFNNDGLAIFSWNLYLGLEAIFSSLPISSILAISYVCNMTSCLACCLIKSCNYFTGLC